MAELPAVLCSNIPGHHESTPLFANKYERMFPGTGREKSLPGRNLQATEIMKQLTPARLREVPINHHLAVLGLARKGRTGFHPEFEHKN
jgi:hypothetical protein